MQISNLSKEFQTRQGRTLVVDNVDLEFPPNKVVALLGPSGSGDLCSGPLDMLVHMLRFGRHAVPSSSMGFQSSMNFACTQMSLGTVFIPATEVRCSRCA